MTKTWNHSWSRRTVRAACAAWMGLLMAGAPGPRPAAGGELRYPALGNIRLARGTIEMWLVPRFDPEASDRADLRNRGIFRLRRDDDNRISLIWRVTSGERDGRTAGFYPTGRIGGLNYAAYARTWHRVGRDDRGWKPGQPRHVAFCWDGQQVWWVIDGQRTVTGQQNLAFSFEINEDMEIVIGGRDESGFAIRDFRISSVPRPDDELGFHFPDGVPSDFHTLLLDRLDAPFTPDGGHETRPVVLTPAAGHRGGRPDAACSFVETPMGPALAF